MPLPACLATCIQDRPYLAELLRGVESEDDIELLGFANIAQLLLKGFWGHMHCDGTPFDQSFQLVLDTLPDDRCRTELGFLWEAMFEPGDHHDQSFRTFLASYTPTAPYLPRLRPLDHFRVPETSYWIQDTKEHVQEDIVEGRTVPDRDNSAHLMFQTSHRLFTCEKQWMDSTVLQARPGKIFTARLMLPWELEFFRAQPNDRLLKLFHANSSDTFAFEHFQRQVREGSIAHLSS